MCFRDMNCVTQIQLLGCLDAFGNDAIKVFVETDDFHSHSAILPCCKEEGVISENWLLQLNQAILREIKGCQIFRQNEIDNRLQELYRNNENKMLLKECLLGVSMAVTRIASCASHRELFEYLGGISGRHLPALCFFDSNGEFWCTKEKDSLKHVIKKCREVCRQLEVLEKNNALEDIQHLCQKNELDIEFFSTEKENKVWEKLQWIEPFDFCSVSAIIQDIREAKAYGKIPILKGELFSTEDSYLADLAVGLNLKLVSFGMPFIGANHIKYNRLIEIESRFV